MNSTKSFNHNIPAYNKNSASVILPFLISQFKISSIIDIGCGIGTWLAVAKEKGINDIIGIDGTYVDKNLLYIESDLFKEKDLTHPFDLKRKFDIAFCLEVAEHIDGEKADILIDSIIRHADLILFSSAIPGQEGEGHINEQWVDYWVEKFKKHNYLFYDIVRPKFWNDPKLEWWYKQNMFIVAKQGHLAIQNNLVINQYIHPELYKRLKNSLEEFRTGRISIAQAAKTLIKSCLKFY